MPNNHTTWPFMTAVDFLHHENPQTWAGVEPATLDADGQRQTNYATQSALAELTEPKKRAGYLYDWMVDGSRRHTRESFGEASLVSLEQTIRRQMSMTMADVTLGMLRLK
ncbi:hypothetical protein TNCV_4214361 [Trichonephila clavipes]|nr:hypothetical protein TNCV_4214361 [Trichonephila clavipes]